MKNNWRLIKHILSFLFVSLLIGYFGLESKNMALNSDTHLFIKMYLDNVQKYLFTMTLFLCITVPNLHIPFLNPELKSRLRNNVFEFVWRRNTGFSLVFSVYIMFSFGIVAAFCGYSNIASILDIGLFFRLFSFTLSFLVLYTTIYLITGKYYLGIALASAANFLFLIILISLNYYIMVYYINDEVLKLLFTLYVLLINISGFTYLYRNMDKKELVL